MNAALCEWQPWLRLGSNWWVLLFVFFSFLDRLGARSSYKKATVLRVIFVLLVRVPRNADKDFSKAREVFSCCFMSFKEVTLADHRRL